LSFNSRYSEICLPVIRLNIVIKTFSEFKVVGGREPREDLSD
jgi:hypothetical protein